MEIQAQILIQIPHQNPQNIAPRFFCWDNQILATRCSVVACGASSRESFPDPLTRDLNTLLLDFFAGIIAFSLLGRCSVVSRDCLGSVVAAPAIAAWVEWLPLVACGCSCSVVPYGCLYRYRYKYKSRYRYTSSRSFLTSLLLHCSQVSLLG